MWRRSKRGVVQLVLVHEHSEMTSKYRTVLQVRSEDEAQDGREGPGLGGRQLKKSEIEG